MPKYLYVNLARGSNVLSEVNVEVNLQLIKLLLTIR
jgi:hypothetical protein